MGRKYYKKHKYRGGGKAGLLGMVLSAISGRRTYPGDRSYGGYDAYGYAPYPRRRSSLKSSLISYVLRRIFRRFH